MAFIHTNFLTGNDTTGDGTTSLPYKTVYKALTVAASADTIKVAGGQWSANLAGNFTFTQGSNIITTSVSQVGTVLVDDILSFEDGQFGFDKFHIKVYAVAAGSITGSIFWPMATTTVTDVKRIETYHYSQATASPAQFETWSTTDIQPAGRTGITISGGWNNTFDAQNGWTVVRRTGQSITQTQVGPSLFNITATGGLGQWGSDLVFDRFMAHTTYIFVISTPAIGSSFAINEIALVKGNLTGSGAGYFGLWQADPLIPAKIYNSNSGIWSQINAMNANYATNIDRPDVFECDLYSTLGFNVANTVNSASVGLFGMLSSVGREGSINQINLKIRMNSLDYTAGGVTYAGYPACTAWAGTPANYVKSIEWFANQPQMIWFPVGNTSTTQIQDMTISGPYANQSCFVFQASGGQFIVDLQAEGKNIDDFKPGQGSLYVANGANTQAPLNQLCQTNLQTVQVRDAEGLKTLDYYNNIYFKTDGALKISSATSFSTNSSAFYQWKVTGVIEKPMVPFIVSFTLKTDTGKELEWDYLGVQYGPNANQVITQALTPTDTYATYTMSVDPGDYGDWTKFSFPLYFGIRAKTANTYDLETMSYAYIQSITVA